MPRVVHLTTVHHLQDPRIFHRQARSLQRAGFDVHVVAQHTRSEVVASLPVTALPPAAGRRQRVGLLPAAFRAARSLQADLYHFHDPELIPVAYALRQATGARIIYDMHEDYRRPGSAEGRLLRGLERWCFTWVDHVVLASDSLEPIVRGRRVPYTLILNYFQPPSETVPAPHPPPDDRLEILYAGIQANARGLRVLLEAARLAHAAARPWRLTLAGVCYRQADRAAADAFIAAEQLEDVVHRAGWSDYLPWAAMEPYYRRAHVGAALLQPDPNYVHTLPTKFYEYMHYGLPILCSDFPRWRRFVEQHGCGAVVAADDPQAVVQQLRRCHEAPACYTRLAEAAAAAAPQYHWSHMETRLVQLYRRLLGPPPTG